MGRLSYYLGYLFVSSHRITSRGLVAVEELRGNVALPARYPVSLTWSDEIRLLFSHFLTVNDRTRDADGRVVPTTTLMNCSRVNPMLFMSLVLQRSHDDYMSWPSLADMSRPLTPSTDEDADNGPRNPVIRGDRDRWRICNYIKLPPVRAPYPASDSVVAAIRAKVAGHRLGTTDNLDDVLPDVLTPEERDILSSCRAIDNQFRDDKLAFMRHC